MKSFKNVTSLSKEELVNNSISVQPLSEIILPEPCAYIDKNNKKLWKSKEGNIIDLNPIREIERTLDFKDGIGVFRIEFRNKKIE